MIVCYTGLSEGSRDPSCIVLCAERRARDLDGHAGNVHVHRHTIIVAVGLWEEFASRKKSP